MVTVKINRGDDGGCQGFECGGHADYSESGSDIVCSAVSMLVINTINSLGELTQNAVEYESDDEEGIITCRFPKGLDAMGNLLMDSMINGIKAVEGKYGSRYVTLVG